MSGLNRKRPGEANATLPTPKRAATGRDAELIEDEKDETYHVTTKLHGKYNVFPELLRNRLQASYVATIQFQINALQSGAVSEYKYTYSVVTERRIRQVTPSLEPTCNTTLCKDSIVSLSLANTALLEVFLKSQKERLEKPSFVMLKRHEGISNPEFTQLHAVRHEEIGWGFDTYGCLSLYLVYIDQGKLREYVIYVQRAELKVEENA
jgi:hypothetical protein